MEVLYPHPLPRCLFTNPQRVVEQVGSDVNYVNPASFLSPSLGVLRHLPTTATTGPPVLFTDTTVKMPGPADPTGFVMCAIGDTQSVSQPSSILRADAGARNAIVKIRKDMPLELVGLLGSASSPALRAVVNTLAKVAPGEPVVVIGCGGVGHGPRSTPPRSPAPAALSAVTPSGQSSNWRTNSAPPTSALQNGDVCAGARLTKWRRASAFEVLGREETSSRRLDSGPAAPRPRSGINPCLRFSGHKIELQRF